MYSYLELGQMGWHHSVIFDAAKVLKEEYRKDMGY